MTELMTTKEHMYVVEIDSDLLISEKAVQAALSLTWCSSKTHTRETFLHCPVIELSPRKE